MAGWLLIVLMVIIAAAARPHAPWQHVDRPLGLPTTSRALALLDGLPLPPAASAPPHITKWTLGAMEMDIDTRIRRPEGAALSPHGNVLAVGSALDNCIHLYVINATLSPVPVFSTCYRRDKLIFFHDLSFSSDDRYLAAACRDGAVVVIYKRRETTQLVPEPVAVLHGQPGLRQPSAVQFFPRDALLAVAFGPSHKVALYRYAPHGDAFEERPYQVIYNGEDVVSVPDGLAVSPDGQRLAMTSHGTHSVVVYTRLPNTDGYFDEKPACVIHDPAHMRYPHSLAFHPLTGDLWVSNAEYAHGKSIAVYENNHAKRIYHFDRNGRAREAPDPSDRRLFAHGEGGVKCVAMASDGTRVAVCSPTSGVHDHVLVYHLIHDS